ncbi:hypothetical protein KP509_02G005200 [Ceratopteris richardii]|uniref:Ubiquitinyl hydrolase 1 n=1 Tax=Ceratopteris richardii TaxID=49495 RepID=A0A8T2VEJ6_CERRI|nr:hypothetical protein KP509_02G005200 [Ceratopteris richardii]
MEGARDQRTFLCKHVERGIFLEKLSQLSKAKLAQCESCLGKGRSTHKKVGRLTLAAHHSCQQEEKWVCLACGHVACDSLLNPEHASAEEENGNISGEKKDENKAPAKGHAWGHFILTKHPLAMQLGDNCAYWCFICHMPVDYPMPSVGNPNDLQLLNWRNPLQEAADVVKGKTAKRKSLFKDPAKAIEPVRCVIDTVKSVIDSATHLRVADAKRLDSLSISNQNQGSSKKHTVKGLINLGNTCFFNSILQNLFALDILRNHFSQEHPESEGSLTSCLRSLFQEMGSENVSTAGSSAFSCDVGIKKGLKSSGTWGSDSKVCNPSSLFDAICAKAPCFRGFQQQDCHELLRYLLEGLILEERGTSISLPIGEYKKVISTSLSKVLGQNGHVTDSDSVEDDKESGKANKLSQNSPSFVESVFGGQLSSTVHCQECGHVSIVHETMLDISLQIPAMLDIRKRQVYTETSSVLDGSSYEPPKESSRHLEQVEMLETQEAMIEATLVPRVLRENISESSISAYPNDFDSVLVGGAEMPPWSKFGRSPSRTSSLTHYENGTTESFSQGASDCVELDHTFSKVVEGIDCSLSTNQLGIDLNGNRIDTTEYIDTACCFSASCEPSQKKQDECISASSKEVPSSSEISVLPCESSERMLRDNDEQSTGSQHSKCQCSLDNCSLKVNKNLSISTSEDIKRDESGAPYSQTKEAQNHRCQEMQALASHPDIDQIGGTPDTLKLINGETNCEVSVKTKVMLESEQSLDSDGVILPSSIEACLADFIKPELLSGENAWECEKCSRLAVKASQSQPPHSKVKFGDGNVLNEILKLPGNDASHLRDEKSVVLNAEALSDAPTIYAKLESTAASDYHKSEEILSMTANLGNLGERSSTIDMEEAGKKTSLMSVNVCNGGPKPDTEQLSDQHGNENSQNLQTDRSVDPHPMLIKPEQAEGNGLGHTYSKILPTLKRDKLSFLSSLFFRTDNQKLKNDRHQKLVKRQAVKKYLICKVPNVLTVHLKRFAQDVRGRLSKLSGHVSFSEYLNLQPFLDPRCPDYHDCIYRLVGIVEHSGTMRGGHYVAYVRGPDDALDGSWYYISDSMVCKSSIQDVLSREAYLLFYERHITKRGG